MEPDWPQHDCPTACVILQQSFPTTFISLGEKFGTHLKDVIISVFCYFFITA
jgi:hypothetical protein